MKKFNENFKFGGSDDFLKYCKGIEDFQKTLNDIHISQTVAYPIDFSKYGNPQLLIGDFFKFIKAQYVAKLEELISSYIDSINSQQYLITGLVGRAIIETIGTLKYYNDRADEIILKLAEVERVEGNPLDPKLMEELFDLIEGHMKGSTIDWSSFFKSDIKTFIENIVSEIKSKNKNPDLIKPLRINNTILRDWSNKVPQVHAFYAFFCDLVHPNLGSNLLLMGTSKDVLQIGGDSNKSLGKKICQESLIFIAFCLNEGALQMMNAVRLSTLGDDLPSPGNETIH